ncbi:hypothetical protein [Saccharothrix stipae]
MIEADFHREYRVDLAVPGEIDRRTWRWFQGRLFGLSPESRTWRHLTARQAPADEVGIEEADAALGVIRE